MKAIRVLHVLGAMNQGGVETWLMHVLRHLDRERFQMDFLVHTDQPAAYDAELLALGARILRCPNPHNPLLFGRRFLAIVKQFGPFDVIHSHVHHYSGYVLSLARAARIPVRIAHSHSDTRTANAGSAVLRQSYLRLSRRLIAANCTHGLAASVPAALALYGPRWDRNPRVKVLHCGIDLDPFRTSGDRASVRSEFGFRSDNVVFGHVGRFVPVKNHAFLVEIAAEIVKREPRARFLFVGDGPLQPALEEQLRRVGIREHAVFAGLRSDVPRLMMGAMDNFLFPSLYEGLPLTLMETQAANLPAIISDTIAPETTVIPALIRRLSLRQSAAVWAESALRHRECRTANALGEIERSPFNVITGIGDLEVIYGS
jgi:glycosyltransferase involved in cell wall biosynthesis